MQRGHLAAAGDHQPVADAECGIGLEIIGARQGAEADAIFAGKRHQGLARRNDMHALAGSRCGASDAPLRMLVRARGDVARNDEALSRPDGGLAGEAVGLQNRGDRDAMAARDRLDRLALRDRDRRTAVPGPMAGRRGLGGNRARDLGCLRPRPVRRRARRAIGNAAGCNRRRPARRRQRLRLDAAHRTRGNRTGHVLRRRIIGRTDARRSPRSRRRRLQSVRKRRCARIAGEQNGTSRRDMWLLTHTIQT